MNEIVRDTELSERERERERERESAKERMGRVEKQCESVRQNE